MLEMVMTATFVVVWVLIAYEFVARHAQES